MTEESESTRAAHGDRVMADALTLDDKDLPKARHVGPKAPENSFGARYEKAMKLKKGSRGSSYRQPFRF